MIFFIIFISSYYASVTFASQSHNKLKKCVIWWMMSFLGDCLTGDAFWATETLDNFFSFKNLAFSVCMDVESRSKTRFHISYKVIRNAVDLFKGQIY